MVLAGRRPAEELVTPARIPARSRCRYADEITQISHRQRMGRRRGAGDVLIGAPKGRRALPLVVGCGTRRGQSTRRHDSAHLRDPVDGFASAVMGMVVCGGEHHRDNPGIDGGGVTDEAPETVKEVCETPLRYKPVLAEGDGGGVDNTGLKNPGYRCRAPGDAAGILCVLGNSRRCRSPRLRGVKPERAAI
jgi:hypothetical protein